MTNSTTHKYGMAYLTSGQMQPEVTINAALIAIDSLTNISVISNTTTTPPASPNDGDTYIIPSGATGAWASNTNNIAVWVANNSAWSIYTPQSGWLAVLGNQLYTYTGSAWTALTGVLPALSGNVGQFLNGTGAWSVPISKDYITGLQLVWNSTTSISVTTGAAYIQSLGRLSLPASTMTLSGLSLTASTMYHVYLYENSGTPTIEAVTTAPVSYYGTAYAKTGDTSRRYLGSFYSNSSSQVTQFVVDGNKMCYSNPNNNIVLSNGSSMSSTLVACSQYAPITAVSGVFRFQNNTASSTANYGYATPGNQTASSTNCTLSTGSLSSANLASFGSIPFDASQNVAYVATSSSASLYLILLAYTFNR